LHWLDPIELALWDKGGEISDRDGGTSGIPVHRVLRNARKDFTKKREHVHRRTPIRRFVQTPWWAEGRWQGEAMRRLGMMVKDPVNASLIHLGEES
jgi:hypothetical protein